MGGCGQNPQTAGVVNGLTCSRSADVWGIALTSRCDLTIAWPARNNTDVSLKATYTTAQTGRTPICEQPG